MLALKTTPGVLKVFGACRGLNALHPIVLIQTLYITVYPQTMLIFGAASVLKVVGSPRGTVSCDRCRDWASGLRALGGSGKVGGLW